jgi:3-methylfumaryl-CoA hydratase
MHLLSGKADASRCPQDIDCYDSSMSLDLDDLQRWIGRTETRIDRVTLTPLQELAAALDREDPALEPGDAIPPCWHWLYFLPIHRHSEIGPDGHARRGDFLPPVALPRRMWAGSRLEWAGPLRVGQSLTRTSRIMDVSGKKGHTGPLVFVHVRHEIADAADIVVVEDQDIVYREAPKAGDATPKAGETIVATGASEPAACDWMREIHPDPVLLFRYSAMTFNGHRIHYDRRYANEVEGYPGLVVHGPLIATLLLDLLRTNVPDAQVLHFAFRATRPLFDLEAFRVCGARAKDGRSVRLWAEKHDGARTMDATATLV